MGNALVNPRPQTLPYHSSDGLASDTMAGALQSVESSLHVTEDPWDWSIDQVVEAVCHHRGLLLNDINVSELVLSNPQAFEKTLRENSVRGLTFLKDVDHSSLRDDLSMKNLGDRSSVIHLIQDLRRKSPKYIAHLHAEAAMRPVSGYDRFSSTGREHGLGSPIAFSPRNRFTSARAQASNAQYTPITAPASRVDSWVLEQQPAYEASSLCHSPAGNRPHNVLAEAPSLPFPQPLSPDTPNAHSVEDSLSVQEVKDKDEEHVTGNQEQNLPKSPISNSDVLNLSANDGQNKVVNSSETNERTGETVIVDETGRKRRRLVLGDPAPLLAPTASEELLKHIPSPTNPPSSEMLQDASTVKDAELLPAVSTTEVSLSTDIEQSKVLVSVAARSQMVTPSLGETKHSADPGVVIFDDKGRKRLKPFLVSQVVGKPIDLTTRKSMVQSNRPVLAALESNKPNLASTPARYGRAASARNPQFIYLGTDALHVDSIIYGNTPLDQELQDEAQSESTDVEEDHPQTLMRVQSLKIASGQRIYVNKQIQRLLRSAEPKVFRNKGELVAGIIPYPDKLARKFQPLSMTVFRKSSNGYTASRVNRSAWRTEDQEPLATTNENQDILNVPQISFGQQHWDPLDPDNLEKWKYLDSEDSVLPVYGDSGSEGEYDLDTWREMENEQGKLGRPSAILSSRKSLNDVQVNAAIDGALEQFVKDWHLTKKPKMQVKGWRLWQAAKRNGNKDARISAITDKLQHLDARLLSLRKEILGEVWSSEKQVIKQTKSMQETVLDREGAKWQMNTIMLKTAPEKSILLQHRTRPKKTKPEPDRHPLAESEEDLDSDDSTSCTSEDGMSDFIVDDNNESDIANDETVMADVEDEGDPEVLPSRATDRTPQPEKSIVASQNVTPKSLVKNPLFKLERKSAKKPKDEAASKLETAYIDLTQLSDPVEPDVPNTQSEADRSFKIRTPPLDAVDDSDDSFRRHRRKPVEFKKPPADHEIIDLESGSDPSGETEKPHASQSSLPELHEIDKICRMDVECLEERQDRRRLLIWVVSRSTKEYRQGAIQAFDELTLKELQSNVWKCLTSLRGHRLRVRCLKASVSTACMLIASWYVCWTIPTRMDQQGGIQIAHLVIALDDVSGFAAFYRFLGECLAHYRPSELETPDQTVAKGTPVKKRVLITEPSGSTAITPNKKRKYVVEESIKARDLQELAKQRLIERERRKGHLKKRFRDMGLNDEDPNNVIINVGKEDDHDFICINPKIGNRIQPHQKEGVQFMWRELTAEHEELQGCLLAHTMGLGKTMQIITLLVTIAEAAKSSNDKISCQIPPSLKKSQTLVLCPPALLENWYEEFLMWAPDPWAENIGEIHKVSSALDLSDRIDEIEQWSNSGGVLLVGYTTFRDLVNDSERKRGRLLTDEMHRRMTEALLNKPNLIIADEAHCFKSMNSGLWKAMKQLKSKSRVALTGSPLSNNLDEYYTLVEWIAPSYLGERVHFHAHYLEPIEQGLYVESTEAEYLESRKRLKALQHDLEPKVHRADISALKGRLKGKTEFLITLPLTALQEQVYNDYVDYMLGTVRAKESTSSKVWAWLEDLRILCNHPKCFEERLRNRLDEAQPQNDAGETKSLALANGRGKTTKNKPKQQAEQLTSDEETISQDGETPDATVDPDIPVNMTEKLLTIFKNLATPLESLSLSHKMVVLKQILDLAEKAGDKTLVFSHSITTLNYLETMLHKNQQKYMRIDGNTPTNTRQAMTREFNKPGGKNICLISTRAGGLGLNMYGANRVIILDTHFNPMYEEQAIGRAYRIGQQKFVYVYRLTIGGTFEEGLLNQSLFKQQLANRVVDKKNPKRHALKGVKQYLFRPRPLTQEILEPFVGKDPSILDKLLIDQENIRSIRLTETFHEEDKVELTAEQMTEVQRLREDLKLQRRNPVAFDAMMTKRMQSAHAQVYAQHPKYVNTPSAGQVIASNVLSKPATLAPPNGTGPQMDMASVNELMKPSTRASPHALPFMAKTNGAAEEPRPKAVAPTPALNEASASLGPVSHSNTRQFVESIVASTTGTQAQQSPTLENRPGTSIGGNTGESTIANDHPDTTLANTAPTSNGRPGEPRFGPNAGSVSDGNLKRKLSSPGAAKPAYVSKFPSLVDAFNSGFRNSNKRGK